MLIKSTWCGRYFQDLCQIWRTYLMKQLIRVLIKKICNGSLPLHTERQSLWRVLAGQVIWGWDYFSNHNKSSSTRLPPVSLYEKLNLRQVLNSQIQCNQSNNCQDKDWEAFCWPRASIPKRGIPRLWPHFCSWIWWWSRCPLQQKVQNHSTPPIGRLQWLGLRLLMVLGSK